MFSEMGIGQAVSEFYELTRDDLDLICLVVSEERELERVIREEREMDNV